MPNIGIPTWEQLEAGRWVIIGIVAYLLFLVSLYLVLKITSRKPIAGIGQFLTYQSFLVPLFLPLDILRPPWWRKKWLKRAGVTEGHVMLEEGFGMGTSPILAARMVGPSGKVYALDNMPLNVAVLWFRAKIRRLKNLKVILSDAKVTGLPNESVDVVFSCDAFHEFPDKGGTLKELYRILRPGGVLAIWDETEKKVAEVSKLAADLGLFSLVEQDKKFRKLGKTTLKPKE